MGKFIKTLLQKNPKKFLKTILTIGLFFVCFSVFNVAYAAFNPQINYQGKLTDASGNPVANGTYNIEFKLYTVSSGGSAIWTETRVSGNKVQVTNGLFSVMLGSVNSIAGVNFDQPLYLGVNIGGTGSPAYDGEMLPRKTFGAVPASFTSQALEGLRAIQFLRSDVINSTSSASTYLKLEQAGAGAIAEFIGNSSSTLLGLYSTGGGAVGIGTTTPGSKLTVAGTATFTGLTNLLAGLFVNGDTITDLTGSGLTVSSGALTVATTSLGLLTTNVAEGTNLYYTDARARASQSESVNGLDYSTSTGVLSLTSGFEIPTTASTTNWNSFWNTPSTRITAGTNLSWSGNTLNATVSTSGINYLRLVSGGLETATTTDFLRAAFFTATSTTGTSTFAGGFTVGGSAFTVKQNGFVGIGTSNPTANLQLYSSSTGAFPSMIMGGNSGTDTDFWFARVNDGDNVDDDVLQFGDGLVPGTNPFLTLNTSGNFGIGTTTPTQKLSVAGNQLVTGTAYFGTDTGTQVGNAGVNVYSANFPYINFTNNTSSSTASLKGFRLGIEGSSNAAFIDQLENSYISFRTNTVEKLRLSAAGGLSLGNSYVSVDPGAGGMILSGNLGIGTTTPTNKLVVQETGSLSAARFVTNTNTGVDTIQLQSLASNAYASLAFLNTAGSVAGGFGYANTGVSSTLTDNVYFYSTNKDMAFSTDGGANEILTLKSSNGNVGIGTTTPSAKLSIVGTVITTGAISSPVSGAVSSERFGSLSSAGQGGSAFGGSSNASGLNSVAIGFGAQATQTNGVTIGAATINNQISSIAIGRESSPTGPYQFVAGSGTYTGNGIRITNVFFGSGPSSLVPLAYTINGSGATSTDVAGGAIAIAGGKGTGAGAPGSIQFQTSATLGSGATLQTLVNRMVIDGPTGNVGIGSSTPVAKFAVKANGTTTGFLAQFTDSNDSPEFTILDNGKVGIGTGAPRTEFEIVSPTSNTLESGNGNIELFTSALQNVNIGPTIAFRGYSSGTSNPMTWASIKSAASSFQSGYLAFGTAPTAGSVVERMRINSVGNVGIGTTTPAYKLEVNGTVGVTGLTSLLGGLLVNGDTITDLTGSGLTVSSGALTVATTSLGLLTTNVAEGTNLYYTDARARASQSESVNGLDYSTSTGVLSLTSGFEIPTTASTTNWNSFWNTPSTRITAGTNLSWSGNTLNATVSTSGINYLRLVSGGLETATTTDFLRAAFFTATSTTGTSTFAGAVGIGTTTPSFRLDVQAVGPSAARFYKNSAVSDPVNALLVLEQGGTGDASVDFYITNGQRWRAGVDNSDGDTFKIASGADFATSTRLVITTAGNVGIGTSSPVAMLGVGGTMNVQGAATFMSTLNFGADVSLSRGAANRLDLATGDSLNIVSGSLQFAGSAGTTGQILQTTGTTAAWVSTSTLGLLGSAVTSSLSNGLIPRWNGTAFVNSIFRENGTVAGINATSSVYTFNIQGTSGVNPFNIASSSGASLVSVDSLGRMGLGITPGETLDVNGDIRQRNIRTYTVTRSLPTSINDSVDIGTVALTNGAGSLWVSITVPSGGYSVAKEYVLPIKYAHTGGVWTVAAPISDTGAYSGNNFALDVNVAAASAVLRIRNTGGVTAGTAYVVIRHEGVNTDTFTASTATGTTTPPTTLFGSTAIAQVGGLVGIGTTTPARILDIFNSTNGTVGAIITNPNAGNAALTSLALSNSADNDDGVELRTFGTGFTTVGANVQDGGLIQSGSRNAGGLSIVARETNSALRFYTGGNLDVNERMRILSSGNVGIGTTTPSDLLTVFKDVNNSTGSSFAVWNPNTGSAAASRFTIGESSTGNKNVAFYYLNSGYTATGTNLPNSGLLVAQSGATNGLVLRTDASAPIIFATNGVAGEKMRITSTGLVGIGTSSPNSLLSVQSGSLDNSASSDRGFTAVFASPNKTLINGTNAGQVAIIANDGSPTADYGGTLSFGAKYTTAGAVAINAAIRSGRDDGVSTSYGGYLTLNTRPNGGNILERLRVTSDGNVGIGTTTPSFRLDVQAVGPSAARFYKNSAVSDPVNALLVLEQGGTGDASVDFYITNGQRWRAGVDNSDGDTFKIASGADFATSTRLVITTAGNVGIGTSSPVAKLAVNSSAAGNQLIINNTQSGTVGGNLSFAVDSSGRSSVNVIGGVGASSIGGAYFNADGYQESWFGVTARSNTSGQRNMRFGNLSNKFSIQLLNDAGNSIISTPFTIENTAPTNSLYVNSLGNVGFGTSTPGSKLTVAGNIFTNGFTTADDTSTYGITIGRYSAGFPNAYMSPSATANGLTFTNPGKTSNILTTQGTGVGAGRVIINSGGSITDDGSNALQVLGSGYFSGNVGFGTTTPLEKLVVDGGATDTKLEIRAAASNFSGLRVKNGTRSYLLQNIGTQFRLTDETSATVPWYIDTSNNMFANGLRINGLDTSNTIYQPSGTLAISSVSGSAVTLGDATVGAVLTVKGGNVGIGTTTPAVKLAVVGTSTFGGAAGAVNINSGIIKASTLTIDSDALTLKGNFIGYGGPSGATFNHEFTGDGYFSSNLEIGGNLAINGSLYDNSFSPGTAGQILLSTGTATAWTSTSSLGLEASFFKQGGNSFGGTAVLGTNSNDNLQFETGGTTRMQIDTGGNIALGGSARINLDALEADPFTWIMSDTYGDIGFANALTMGSPAGNFNWVDGEDNSIYMVLRNGKLGVGDDTPGYRLSVTDTAGPQIGIGGGSNQNGLIMEAVAGSNEYYIFTGNPYSNGGGLSIYNTNTSAYPLTILDNSFIGMGVGTPLAKLHISDTSSAKLKLSGGTTQNGMTFDAVGGANEFYVYSGDPFSNGGNFGIYNNTTASQMLTILDNGNVGIGMTAPAAKLQVNGTVSLGDVTSNYTPTTLNWSTTGTTMLLNALDYSTIGFHDGGARVDFIRTGAGTIQLGYDGGWGAANIGFPGTGMWTSAGNLGIGTTTPGQKLTVTGNAYVSGTQTVVGSVGVAGCTPGATVEGQVTTFCYTGYGGFDGLRIKGTDTANSIYKNSAWGMASNGGADGVRFDGAGMITLTTANVEALRATNGNIGIGGGTAATEKLQVNSTAGNLLRLAYDNTGIADFVFSREPITTGSLLIQGTQVGNNNIILAPTSGNVGIGANPASFADGGLTPRLIVANASDATKWIGMGYDDTGDYSFIQSVDHLTAYKPLNLQPSGGFVGIGTTAAPTAMLTVNGDINLSGNRTITQSGTGQGVLTILGQLNNGSGTGGTVNVFGATVSALGGAVNIAGGTSTSAFIGGAVNIFGGSTNGAGTGGNVYISGGTGGSNLGKVILGLTASGLNGGNISLGTTTSLVKFEIAGKTRFLSSTAETPSFGKGLEIQYNGTDDRGEITSYDRSGLAMKELRIESNVLLLNFSSGGSVAIGTSTPNATLAVYSATSTGDAFKVTGPSGANLLSVKYIAANFGALVESGAFMGNNSYYAQEFNLDTSNGITADSAVIGDNGSSYFDTTATTMTYTASDAVGGFGRLTAGATSSGGMIGFGNAQNNLSTIFLKANLPVVQMKVRTNINNSQNDIVWGLMNQATAPTVNDTLPANGIFFWNNNAAGGWQGVVRSGGVNVGTASCPGSISTTQFAIGRIQVESATVVRFLIDNDVSNGVQMVDCGTVTGANPTVALGVALYNVHTETTGSRTVDLDYVRVWQDDADTDAYAVMSPVDVSATPEKLTQFLDNGELVDGFELIKRVQEEDGKDSVAIVKELIKRNMEIVSEFVAVRVVAVRGYFEEVFTKKIHSEQICLKKSDGSEYCVDGDKLQEIVEGQASAPTASQNPPTDSGTPVTDTSTSTLPTDDGEDEPAETPEPTPEPAPAPAPEPAPTPSPESAPVATE